MTDTNNTVQNYMDEKEIWRQSQLPAINADHQMTEQQEEDGGKYLISKGYFPEYLVELANLKMDEEKKLELLSIYEGAETVSFTEYTNMDVEIAGAIIWYHPPFKGRPDDKGVSVIKDGYTQIRFLTTMYDNKDMPIIIGCSEGMLSGHVRAMLAMRGWYMWDEPVTYRFLYGGPGKPYRMVSTKMLKERQAKHAQKSR